MTPWIRLACALIVLTGASIFGYQMLLDPVPEPTIELHGREGPSPSLELVGEKFHNFGSMALDGKGAHTWEFKNVGEGPLDVWLEDTSCSCTVAKLKAEVGDPNKKVTVAPGQSTPIEVSWEGRKPGRFGQTATLGTNDPANPTVMLTVLGTIIAPVDVQPSETVAFPEFSTEEPHRDTLAIVSPDRPGLKLTRIVTSRPRQIVAEARPMAPDELERRKVKSGYTLTVEIKPGMPLGRFTEEVMIVTDHPKRPEVKVTVVGSVIGPISVAPPRVRMPSVASGQGGSQDLALVVRGATETHFEVASKPEKVTVSIAREEKPEANGRYRMTVIVPPGTPPGVLDDPIVLKTDHPKVSEVRIPVSIYVSSRSGPG
jgi:hypothetical protein